MNTASDYWRKCSTCKSPITYKANYYLCSVSTCRRKRTGLVFCSLSCWEGHLGYANHRESFAEDAVAPSKEEADMNDSTETPKKRIIVDSLTTPSAANTQAIAAPTSTETLVVVSKVKKFVKDHAGCNTSQCAIDALTQKVVDECMKGVQKAEAAGRKTLMGRDIK